MLVSPAMALEVYNIDPDVLPYSFVSSDNAISISDSTPYPLSLSDVCPSLVVSSGVPSGEAFLFIDSYPTNSSGARISTACLWVVDPSTVEFVQSTFSLDMTFRGVRYVFTLWDLNVSNVSYASGSWSWELTSTLTTAWSPISPSFRSFPGAWAFPWGTCTLDVSGRSLSVSPSPGSTVFYSPLTLDSEVISPNVTPFILSVACLFALLCRVRRSCYRRVF